ncbi:MAG: hypothetical protein ABIH88_03450 [Patescibacteria group bacterium]
MKEGGSSLLEGLKNVLLRIILIVIILFIFLYVWPLLQGGYKELPSILQIPFEILLDIFAPGNQVTTASGETFNWVSPGVFGVLAILIIWLLVRLWPKSGKKEE